MAKNPSGRVFGSSAAITGFTAPVILGLGKPGKPLILTQRRGMSPSLGTHQGGESSPSPGTQGTHWVGGKNVPHPRGHIGWGGGGGRTSPIPGDTSGGEGRKKVPHPQGHIAGAGWGGVEHPPSLGTHRTHPTGGVSLQGKPAPRRKAEVTHMWHMEGAGTPPTHLHMIFSAVSLGF